MGNFIKIGTTLTNPNITKLTRDSIIDQSTVFLADLSRKASNPAQVDLSNGNLLYNLTNGGLNASTVTGTKILFSQSGKYLTKEGGDISSRIKLPDSCRIKATDNSFQFTLWFTHLDTADTTGSQALAGYASNSSNNMPFAFYWYNGQYNLGCASRVATFDTPANNTLHQLSVACHRNLGIRRYYHNGVLIRSEVNQEIPTMPVPAEGTDPWLFYLGGGFNSRRNFKLHRVWLDINGLGSNFDTKVVRDWNENKLKF